MKFGSSSTTASAPLNTHIPLPHIIFWSHEPLYNMNKYWKPTFICDYFISWFTGGKCFMLFLGTDSLFRCYTNTGDLNWLVQWDLFTNMRLLWNFSHFFSCKKSWFTVISSSNNLITFLDGRQVVWKGRVRTNLNSQLSMPVKYCLTKWWKVFIANIIHD